MFQDDQYNVEEVGEQVLETGDYTWYAMNTLQGIDKIIEGAESEDEIRERVRPQLDDLAWSIEQLEDSYENMKMFFDSGRLADNISGDNVTEYSVNTDENQEAVETLNSYIEEFCEYMDEVREKIISIEPSLDPMDFLKKESEADVAGADYGGFYWKLPRVEPEDLDNGGSLLDQEIQQIEDELFNTSSKDADIRNSKIDNWPSIGGRSVNLDIITDDDMGY